ncbi:hypothetical protein ABW21_db0200674 [Orbilia brochopaga]|nr:hypothetical protein ABW21_db0200674 [Drechslerella brochopaga]
MSIKKTYDGGSFGLFAFDVSEEQGPVVLRSNMSKDDCWELGVASEAFRKLKAAARGEPSKITDAKTVKMRKYKHCMGSDGFLIEDRCNELEEVVGLAFRLEGMKYMVYLCCQQNKNLVCDIVPNGTRCARQHYTDLWIAEEGEIEVTDATTARQRTCFQRLCGPQHKEASTKLLLDTMPGVSQESLDLTSVSRSQSPPPDLTDHPKWIAINTTEGRAACRLMEMSQLQFDHKPGEDDDTIDADYSEDGEPVSDNGAANADSVEPTVD